MNRNGFLGVSLLLNILLVGALAFVALRKPDDASTRTETGLTAPAADRPQRGEANTSADKTTVTNRMMQAFDWRMVESADYQKYIANLRAIGCPEETIRDIIVADVNKLFESRRREITASTNKFEFWKTGNPMTGLMPDPGRLEKLQALNEEKRALLKALLGVVPEEKPDLMGGFNPFETMLDFLPSEKQNEVMEVYMKYQTKLASSFGEGGMPDAEDMKKMQEIQKEMDRELAAMMSPEQYEDYQLRMSQTAMMMRMQLDSFEPTEQEFRDIFNQRKQFDDEFSLLGMATANREERERRQAAEAQLNDQIKSVLGEERYADYERSQDFIFQGIYRVTERHDLPQETAVKVYDMKAIAEQEAARVRADQSLTPEQQAEALQGIRFETENSIQTVLGDKAWSSFQDQPANYWLRGISPDPGE